MPTDTSSENVGNALHTVFEDFVYHVCRIPNWVQAAFQDAPEVTMHVHDVVDQAHEEYESLMAQVMTEFPRPGNELTRPYEVVQGNLLKHFETYVLDVLPKKACDKRRQWGECVVLFTKRGTSTLRRLIGEDAEKHPWRVSAIWTPEQNWTVTPIGKYKNRRQEKVPDGAEVLMSIFFQEAEEAFRVQSELRQQLHRPTLRTSNDVSEVFSPPRVVVQAPRYGLSPGISLDLTVSDEYGRPWDLSDHPTRERVIKLVEAEKPMLIIGSPPCTMFSQLQSLVKHMTDEHIWNQRMEQAVEHLRFCMFLYLKQVKDGRYFLHEHPSGASSWYDGAVQEVLAHPGVIHVQSHMCRFGMTTSVPCSEERKLVLKPTGFMTNSPEVARMLDRRCSNKEGTETHDHGSLIGGGRARAAQGYPPQLCSAILKGLRNQLKADGVFYGPIDMREPEGSFPVDEGADIEPEEAEEANPPEVVPPPENEPQDEYDVPIGDDVPNSEQQRLLRTIHINLGHPSKPDFCRALRHGKCRPGAIEWVKKHFRCPECETSKRAGIRRPATIARSYRFNHVVGADLVFLEDPEAPGQKMAWLNVVC